METKGVDADDVNLTVFELREIDELLGELDHLLWRMYLGPDDRRRSHARRIRNRIKALLEAGV